MLSFESDYTEGAHEKVLQRFVETNMEHCSGYGADLYCQQAKEKIKEACDCPQADVHFLVGGTQTNQVVIDAVLNSYEGVIAAITGHVSIHEAGAIEYTGHKVLELPAKEGKIDAKTLKQYMVDFYQDPNHEHMVFPGMVYISHPTEYGTLYQKQEMEEIAQVCAEFDLPFYLDGARLVYGLASQESDVTLKDIARLCDVFYIGGTKAGLLCGEAVVFTKNNTPKHFMTTVKQHGALLAKGRLLGIQFDTLFTDDLYMEMGRHAIAMVNLLKKALKDKGYQFYLESFTNQQFIVLKNDKMADLKRAVAFSFWEKADEEQTVVRFATSWATKEEDVEKLIDLL